MGMYTGFFYPPSLGAMQMLAEVAMRLDMYFILQPTLNQ